MREIKFRYVFKKPSGHIISYLTDIQHLEHSDIANFLQHNFLSIERDLISRDEYTGLKDKNGKEIYERDIIRGMFNRNPQNWSVNELSPYGVSFTRLTIQPLSPPYSYRDMRHREEWEVIGNIYENPELLGS